jgi:tripartite motif-containing protein 71
MGEPSDGDGDGQMRAPTGVTAAPDGSVYVVNHDIHRVKRFDSAGAFLGALGHSVFHDQRDGAFLYPYGVAAAPDGLTVYVTDTGNHRIQAFCVIPHADEARPSPSPNAGTPIGPAPVATPA